VEKTLEKMRTDFTETGLLNNRVVYKIYSNSYYKQRKKVKMKKIFYFSAALTLLVCSCTAQGWTWDKAHSQLNFGITHMNINEIDGRFLSVDAKLNSSREDLSDAVISLDADIKSINTGNEMRDNNLKGPDCFDADKYGTLSFRSTSFKKLDSKHFELVGDLTLHGVTRQVMLNVVFNGTVTSQMNKKFVSGFKVSGTIKRSEFGIAPSYPTTVLSDEVILNANAEFVKD
jgi:polyisoprenoid-binding protein YceI